MEEGKGWLGKVGGLTAQKHREASEARTAKCHCFNLVVEYVSIYIFLCLSYFLILRNRKQEGLKNQLL